MGLTDLPAGWVALAVEAGDYQDPMFLHFEEEAIRESAHSRAAYAPVNERELQGAVRECFDRGFNRRANRSPSSGRILEYHARASNKSSLASEIQTTGSVTVSETGET